MAAFWQLFTIRPGLAAAFSVVLLLGGLGLGLLINRPKTVIVQASGGCGGDGEVQERRRGLPGTRYAGCRQQAGERKRNLRRKPNSWRR